MQKRNLVLAIAKVVRKVAEDFQDKDGNFYDGDVSEKCAITSAFFVKKLSEVGINADLVIGTYEEQGHAWVEYENHIIDLTVSQFNENLPKVYIVRTNHKKYRKIEIMPQIENKQCLKALFSEWPTYQIPKESTLKKFEKIYQKKVK